MHYLILEYYLCIADGHMHVHIHILTHIMCTLVHIHTYTRAHTHAYTQEAMLTFSYPVSGEGWRCGGDSVLGGGWEMEDDALQQMRTVTVMVIPANQLQSAITELSSALS